MEKYASIHIYLPYSIAMTEVVPSLSSPFGSIRVVWEQGTFAHSLVSWPGAECTMSGLPRVLMAD